MAIGSAIGIPLFFLVNDTVGTIVFWLPVIAGIVIAFIRQHRSIETLPTFEEMHAQAEADARRLWGDADLPPALLDTSRWTLSDEHYHRLRMTPVSEVMKDVSEDADLKINVDLWHRSMAPGPHAEFVTPVTDRIGTLRHQDGTIAQCHGYPKHNIFGPHPKDGKRWWQIVVHNPRHKFMFSNDEIAQWPVIFEGEDD
ncbi:hypothetical protein ORI20_13925 [Mycobacterium sp. CVI_P3]|uniref:Uncharacterized protein n=1 Tax=Mycobacterium pinniadriaticum TaxID=2994102 RepID=A0ABT3SE67_9MYCO|nr:hypothetical protein [Mycobacterium pinniadriaticum]MCX2931378.1 hypothetical protein [Mycobacterium pinniadriaticum]MCX2937802.1 hypothetical protein [Mycobacterium pinniadriaticum]